MFEEIYSKDNNKEVKKLLVNTLTELGIDLSFNERYDAAVMAFKTGL